MRDNGRWRNDLVNGYHPGMGSRAEARQIIEDSDALILVDENDREIGHSSKDSCHAGPGLRHRAFSVLIFNDDGELLVQQRAASKRLWPLYWSNSCCSHPRRGESLQAAADRRLYEELGLRAPLKLLYKFHYQARFDATGSENELCSVLIGHSGDPVRANDAEIHAWRWMRPQSLEAEMAADGGGRFTPWFLLEWARIWRDHRSEIAFSQSSSASRGQSV